MPCPGWYYCENAAVTGISQPYGFPPGLNVNLSGSLEKGQAKCLHSFTVLLFQSGKPVR